MKMKMNIKATHNSSTGEASKEFLSYIVIPFSKCQSKTLVEQYKAGCRIFDIRVKFKYNTFVFAHGLWESKVNVYSILNELNKISTENKEDVYYLLTYEGKIKDNLLYNKFIKFGLDLTSYYKHLHVIQMSVKKPTWEVLVSGENCPYDYKLNYEVFLFPNLKTLFPIPWFWNLFRKKSKDENVIEMVDFL